MKHDYPPSYPPGSHWSVTVAWHILDTLEPGKLNIAERSLLAGMIAGALVEVASRTKDDERP